MDNHFKIENKEHTIYLTTSVKPRFYAYILLVLVIGVLIIPLFFVGFASPDSVMVSLTFIVLWVLFPINMHGGMYSELKYSSSIINLSVINTTLVLYKAD